MPPVTASISLDGDAKTARSASTSPGMALRPSPSRAALLRGGGFDTEAPPMSRSPSPARAGAPQPSIMASLKALLGTAGVPPSPATKAAACFAYGGVSVCITIFNKAVFSTHGFPYPAFVTLLQVKKERGGKRRRERDACVSPHPLEGAVCLRPTGLGGGGVGERVGVLVGVTLLFISKKRKQDGRKTKKTLRRRVRCAREKKGWPRSDGPSATPGLGCRPLSSPCRREKEKAVG